MTVTPSPSVLGRSPDFSIAECSRRVSAQFTAHFSNFLWGYAPFVDLGTVLVLWTVGPAGCGVLVQDLQGLVAVLGRWAVLVPVGQFCG